MSDQVLIALIVGLPLIIAAVGNLYVSIKASALTARTAEIATATAAKLDSVHREVNGKMTQLLETKGAASMAEGEAIGREKATAERQIRVAEAERVEDRVADKLTVIEQAVKDHDEWERGTKKQQ